MIPLIPALAALAVQQGPAMIRGIASLFGGSDTANKVADMVEQVSGIGFTAEQQQANIEQQLMRLPPEAIADLQKLKVELEKEQTRRLGFNWPTSNPSRPPPSKPFVKATPTMMSTCATPAR